MVNKIDSNLTGLAFAEEETPKTLPGSPVWYALAPNSYPDFGGDIKTVAREPINASRQDEKGTTTDLDAAGGFSMDLTQQNSVRLAQGFMFADAHEKFDTAPLNGSSITITAVDGTNDQFEASSGLTGFAVGDLILATGFGLDANNGLHVIEGVASAAVDVATNLTAEASPPADARIQAVGFQFEAGDATLTLTSGVLKLSATTKNLTQLGLSVGEWIWLGGDSSSLQFSQKGFARVLSIAAGQIVFDKVTNGSFATDAAGAKTVQIFFGKFIKNEKEPEDIIMRSYQFERTLGSDDDGVQAEYITGQVANELSIKVPSADKVTVDFGFIGLDHLTTTGAEGLADGDRVDLVNENAFNTSSSVYRLRMNIIDPATLLPTALFAYVTNATINIKNNASAVKAVGTLGGIDISVGNFNVSGDVEAYFTNVAAISAIRDNSDVTLDLIFAQENAGVVVDIPLLGLGGGKLNVQKDQPIKVPLQIKAGRSTSDFTFGMTFLPYLPTVAMPS
jgi:hypothetical protein